MFTLNQWSNFRFQIHNHSIAPTQIQNYLPISLVNLKLFLFKLSFSPEYIHFYFISGTCRTAQTTQIH